MITYGMGHFNKQTDFIARPDATRNVGVDAEMPRCSNHPTLASGVRAASR